MDSSQSKNRIEQLKNELSNISALLSQHMERGRLTQIIDDETKDTLLRGVVLNEDGGIDFSLLDAKLSKLPPTWLKLAEKFLYELIETLNKLAESNVPEKSRFYEKLPVTADTMRELQSLGLEDVINQGVARDIPVNILSKDGERIPSAFTGAVIKDKSGVVRGVVAVAKDLRKIKEYAKSRLEEIAPILQKISIGDLSQNLDIPEKEDEFTELLTALNLMIEDLKEAESTKEEAERTKIAASVAVEEEKRRLAEEESEKLERQVSERTKELEGAHKKIEENLQEVSRLKDEFVFVATHELKAPVSVIQGYLGEIMDNSKLKEYVEKQDPELQEMLDGLDSAKNRLMNLTRDLLDVARMEAGKFRIEPQETDINKLLGSVAESLSSSESAKRKNIKINFEMLGDIPKIVIDPNRLTEITTNLITNAVKYNKQDGSVDVSASLEGDKLRIMVADTGIGLTEEEKSHLFEKFWRAGDAKMEEGTGLGLFIVKHMLEQMGGDITVESEKGKGTTFSFVLPVKSVN